jgi:hypothetical protein
MADIGIAKTGIRAARAAQTDQAATQKTHPSKFDSIRSQLAEQLGDNLKLPPTKQISDQRATNLETALRKRLTQTTATNPSHLFATDMRAARANVNRLNATVNKMPDNKSSATIRNSLSSIEAQYQQSAKLIGGTKGMDLQGLLKIQVELYQMSENINLLSKVVDQVTSGVKTIFQTQVG